MTALRLGILTLSLAMTAGCGDAKLLSANDVNISKESTILTLKSFSILGYFDNSNQTPSFSLDLDTGEATAVFEGDMAVICEPSDASKALLQDAINTVRIRQTLAAHDTFQACPMWMRASGPYFMRPDSNTRISVGDCYTDVDYDYVNADDESKINGVLDAYRRDCQNTFDEYRRPI